MIQANCVLGTPVILKRVVTVMVHKRNVIAASTGWFLLLLLCGGCITHPLGVRDPVAPTAFPEHDLVPLRDHACVSHAPFYGYNATCWRSWPQDWRGCPPQDPSMVIGEGSPFEDDVEIIGEDPSGGSQVPTLAPIPMPEGAGPLDPVPTELVPTEPVPTDMMPEIPDDGLIDNTSANPGSDGTLDTPPEEDAGESTEVDPVQPPADSAPPQEPSQTRDEPESEPVAAKVVAAAATEEAPAYVATANRVDVRFGNVVSLVVHDGSITADDDAAMPNQNASTPRVFQSRVRPIPPTSPERAQPNRLAIFDTEKASSDLESAKPSATQ